MKTLFINLCTAIATVLLLTSTAQAQISLTQNDDKTWQLSGTTDANIVLYANYVDFKIEVTDQREFDFTGKPIRLNIKKVTYTDDAGTTEVSSDDYNMVYDDGTMGHDVLKIKNNGGGDAQFWFTYTHNNAVGDATLTISNPTGSTNTYNQVIPFTIKKPADITVGKNAQVVLNFEYENGKALTFNPPDGVFVVASDGHYCLTTSSDVAPQTFTMKASDNSVNFDVNVKDFSAGLFDGEWHKSVTVPVRCTDNSLYNVLVQDNNGNLFSTNDNLQYVIDYYGENSVTYQINSPFNDILHQSEHIVKIDNIPPSLPSMTYFNADNDELSYSDNVTIPAIGGKANIKLSSEDFDDGSGIYYLQYINTSTIEESTVNNNSTIELTPGIYKWAVKAFDKALNESSPKNLAFNVQNLFTVTIDKNGHGKEDVSSPQKKFEGEKIDQLIDLTDDAYNFQGWYVDDTKWNFTENTVYNDLTLIAKWQIKSYNVTFYNGTQFLSSVSVVYSAKTPKFTPTKTGYNFYKWTITDNIDAEEYDITTPVTSDLTLYAQWEKAKYWVTLPSHIVFADASTNKAEFEYQSTVNFKVEDGYKLISGFSTTPTDLNITKNDGDIYSFTVPAQDVTINASIKGLFNVTFETEHGTAPDPQKILYGEKVSEPETPTTTDPYDFLYWQTADNIQWNFTESTVYNDLTLIAKWQIKSYNVTFYNGTQFLSSISVVHGAKTPKFTPTKIGYNFYKWTITDNVDAEEYDITNPVTSDLTLYAQWEKQKINFLPEITIAENLVYNGQPQNLITYTQSEDMPLQFKVNNGDYSNTLPSATNVGTYTIWYRSKPDFDSKLYSQINETSLGIVSIEPKLVTVTINSSAVISKTYDGTTNINQSLADIAAFDGLIENDDVNFEYTAQYDNPNVGSGKVITLTFKLTGNNANNYNLTNEIVTISTGEIKPIEPTLSFNKENSFTGFAAIGKHLWATASSNGIDSIPGTYTYSPTAGTELNEGIHTITVSFTPTDEYSYYGSAEKSFTVEIYNKLIIKDDEIIQETLEHYCAKSLGNIELRFTALYGKPSYYSIIVDEIPEMSSDGIVTSDNDDTYLIELGTSSNAEPGKYNGTITFFADEQHKAPICEPLKFILTVNIPHNVIKQLYENVIFVDNHDELFIGYQWRKNGVEILKPEATRQYYYERILDGNEYSVDLTLVNGITLTACPITKDELVKTLRTVVTPYPNPAKANQPFTLKIIGGVPENATIMIFNNSGALVQRIDNVTENTTITLPHGYYSGALIYDGQKVGFKIIVE